jgi:hypothetical protein
MPELDDELQPDEPTETAAERRLVAHIGHGYGPSPARGAISLLLGMAAIGGYQSGLFSSSFGLPRRTLGLDDDDLDAPVTPADPSPYVEELKAQAEDRRERRRQRNLRNAGMTRECEKETQ